MGHPEYDPEMCYRWKVQLNYRAGSTCSKSLSGSCECNAKTEQEAAAVCLAMVPVTWLKVAYHVSQRKRIRSNED